MKVGVELLQLFPGASGGLVYWLQDLLTRVSRAKPDWDWVLFCPPHFGEFWPKAPKQATRLEFASESYFQELDRYCEEESVDILLRSFPLDACLRFPRQRQIMMLPDLQHQSHPEFFDRDELEQRKRNFWQSRMLGALVVPSEYTRRQILEGPLGWDRRVAVCPPLPIDDLEEPAGGNGYSAPGEKPYFLYPANLWPHKNHSQILQAFSLYHKRQGHCRLLLTGDKLGRWDVLRQEFSHLPVEHLGYVPKETLERLYKGARALIFFSTYEGFGMPILEAFRHDLPVGCSNQAALPEVAGKAALYADPNCPEEMAGVMARLEAEPRHNLSARRAARFRYYREYPSGSNFVNLCEGLLEASQRGPSSDCRRNSTILIRQPGSAAEFRLARLLKRASPRFVFDCITADKVRPDMLEYHPSHRLILYASDPVRYLKRWHGNSSRRQWRFSADASPDLYFWLRNSSHPPNPQVRLLLGSNQTNAEARLRAFLESEDVFVGIAEQELQSQRLFCELYGLSSEVVSAPTPDLPKVSDEVRTLVAQYHPLDCLFYDLALKSFESRRQASEKAETTSRPLFERTGLTGCYPTEFDDSGLPLNWTGFLPFSVLPLRLSSDTNGPVTIKIVLAGAMPAALADLKLELNGHPLETLTFEYAREGIIVSGKVPSVPRSEADSPVYLSISSSLSRPPTQSQANREQRRLGVAIRDIEVLCE